MMEASLCSAVPPTQMDSGVAQLVAVQLQGGCPRTELLWKTTAALHTSTLDCRLSLYGVEPASCEVESLVRNTFYCLGHGEIL